MNAGCHALRPTGVGRTIVSACSLRIRLFDRELSSESLHKRRTAHRWIAPTSPDTRNQTLPPNYFRASFPDSRKTGPGVRRIWDNGGAQRTGGGSGLVDWSIGGAGFSRENGQRLRKGARRMACQRLAGGCPVRRATPGFDREYSGRPRRGRSSGRNCSGTSWCWHPAGVRLTFRFGNRGCRPADSTPG